MRTTLALLALSFFAPAVSSSPLDAVVKLTSHGGSGTVIWTGPGKSYILSAHHMFSGKDYSRPVKVEAPHPKPAQHQPGVARCIGVDQAADLALVEVSIGPMPYFCSVAPAGHRPGRLISCGYDRLQWHAQGAVRATAREAHLLSGHPQGVPTFGFTRALDLDHDSYEPTAGSGNFQYTRELPWHGRSGGGLIDIDNGVLIGVVSGYSGTSPKTWAEVKPGACGIYGSHPAILRFVARTAPQALQPPAAVPQGYGAPAPQQGNLQDVLRQIQMQQEQINRLLGQDSNRQPGRPFVEEWHESPDGQRRVPAPQPQFQQPIVYAPPQQIPITPLTRPQQQVIPQQQPGRPYCLPGGT